MVKIKLSQTGKRNRKTYRIVVMEEGKRREEQEIMNITKAFIKVQGDMP